MINPNEIKSLFFGGISSVSWAKYRLTLILGFFCYLNGRLVLFLSMYLTLTAAFIF